MKNSYSSILVLLLLMNISMVWTALSQEQVAQTVYVFDEDFNGSLLSDVQVIGQDAAGNSFEGITDSNGSVVIYGEPGTWQFTFMKEGYDTIDVDHDVTQTGEATVYLQRSSQPIQSQGQAESSQTDQQSSTQSIPQQTTDYAN
jgi:hypothetical protein